MSKTSMPAPRAGRTQAMGWYPALLATSRACLIATVWLLLFLATFLGYLTIPVLLIGVFFGLHLLLDGRPLRWVKRRLRTPQAPNA